MRTAVALVLVAGLTVSLAACSSDAPAVGDCAATPSGSVSEAVKVSGKIGAEPKVEFEAPLTVKTTQRSVAIAGTGDKVAQKNDLVTIDFSLYNATNGTKLESSSYTEADRVALSVNEDMVLPGLVKTLQCSQVGSRVVGVVPSTEAFGESGAAEQGIAPGDSLIFVADVVTISAGAATGESVPIEDDSLPTVKLAEDGRPTITIPDSDPPADLKLAVLKQGDGDVVADGDNVTVQYVGMNWNTKTVFDESWSKNGPISFVTTGVVPGFSQGMVGQKVGSQILVVIPPELGYGPSGGTPDGSISATDTIVFVIDILATAPAPAP